MSGWYQNSIQFIKDMKFNAKYNIDQFYQPSEKLQFMYWNNSTRQSASNEYETKYVISKKFNFIEYQNSQSQSPCNQIFYLQSNTCELLLPDGKTACKDCNALKQRIVSERTWKSKKVGEPAKPKAPITLTSPERLMVNSVTLFFLFKTEICLYFCTQVFNPYK